ncbi:MAG: hypothetical protein ACF8GE_09590 [Phycisphaerales bacterium JB043]
MARPAQASYREESGLMVTSRSMSALVVVAASMCVSAAARGGVVHRANIDRLITPIGGLFDIDDNGTHDFNFFTGSVLDTSGLALRGQLETNEVLSSPVSEFAESVTKGTAIGLDGQTFDRSAALTAFSCESSRDCFYATTMRPDEDGLFYIGVRFRRWGINRNGMIAFQLASLTGNVLIKDVYYETEENGVLYVPSPGAISALVVGGLIGVRRRR